MKLQVQSVLFLVALFSFAGPLHAEEAQSSLEKWLIIGGTRGTGFALAQELNQRMKTNDKLACSLFVHDSKKAKKLFSGTKVTWQQGSVASDVKALEKAAKGATYIVIAATFPYKIWEKSIRGMIDNCLTVAHTNNSTLLYLGRTFKYGAQKEITEESAAQPNSHQGRVLKEIEAQIEQAGTNNLVKTRIICHSFPFGPNIGDGLLDKNFRDMLKTSWLGSASGKFEWIARGNVSMQLTYTPDLANFIIDYLGKEKLQNLNFHRTNFEGLRISSINTLGKEYAKKAGVLSDYNLSLYSHAGLSLASWVRPEATRAKDVYYAFEKEVILDGSLRRSLFKEYALTPLEKAVDETYQWYNSHK